MPLLDNELYIKTTDEGIYTVVFNGITYYGKDYVDIKAIVMYSEGKRIHLFDPFYAESRGRKGNEYLLRFTNADDEAEDYTQWLTRRAGS